ncbi:MAG: hypothetical protein A3H27_10410 [Acidobacteria bacterium RIFCSPLOWO2_02_FULL_59_13]|nr:MAG: hypothetical protein A3H27_10410 [Acidobacteria bacterium RIFCSPLOWO2_02_FULL_59_13]
MTNGINGSSTKRRTPTFGIWFFSFALAWFITSDAVACEEVRAALDIGSGTTKMVVARVDYCNNRVLQVLAPSPGAKLERIVEYSKHMVEASDGRKVFTNEVVAQGLATILELKAVALAHEAETFSAVATSAFRSVDPTHARAVVERIRQETGFSVVVIPQDREARIGFLAAAIKVGIPRERLVVWDIGGGSMQMSYWDREKDSVAGYLGDFANAAMHQFLIEVVQGINYRATASPNPILKPGNDNDLSLAIQRAETAARVSVPAGLLERLRTVGTEVIGIGGVHFFSNCEFMRRFSADGCAFTRDELLDQLYRYAYLTDRELVEAGLSATLEFAPYRVSGAALTLGFMNAFGIEKIRAIKVDMGDGILIDPDFWDSP